LLTSSFAAQSPHSTLLADTHGRPLPRGPTRSHHQPRRRRHAPTSPCPCTRTHRVAVLLACCTNHGAGPSSPQPPCCRAPHGCTHRLTLPFAAARATLPCFLHQLTLCSYVFLFLFYANFLFCDPVTALSSPMDAQPSSFSRAYHGATTDRNDSGTMVMMRGDDVATRT
jgi:hypothetical protein